MGDEAEDIWCSDNDSDSKMTDRIFTATETQRFPVGPDAAHHFRKLMQPFTTYS